MLDTLITSKTRIKLLLKFFLNANSESYLRGLGEEFGESTNAIRIELNKFEKAGLLNARMQGNKKLFKANTSHPLFPEIHNILLKHVGLDKVVDKVVAKLGNLEKVFLKGNLARGIDSDTIELLFVALDVDTLYLEQLIRKLEKKIGKKIIYTVNLVASEELYKFANIRLEGMLLLWQR